MPDLYVAVRLMDRYRMAFSIGTIMLTSHAPAKIVLTQYFVVRDV